MQLHPILSLLFALPAVVASPCKPASSCSQDACLNDLLASRLVAKADCSANLFATAPATVSIVYETTTITSIPTGASSVIATSTVLIEATDIVSVVETDLVDYTATLTQSDVETVTADAIVTVTVSNAAPTIPSPEKRDALIAIPSYASSCTAADQYKSACSCLGVQPAAATGTVSPSTRYITVIATEPADIAVTTVQAVPLTITTSTVSITETFSTEIVSQAVDTFIDVVTYSTETIVATGTTTVTSLPTVHFSALAIGSNDPSLAITNGIGFVDLEPVQNIETVSYVDMTSDATSTIQFGYIDSSDEFHHLLQYDASSETLGKGLYYSLFTDTTNAGNAGYVSVAPDDFATDRSLAGLQCKIQNQPGYDYLVCLFGANQIADFWTCKGRLVVVRPGYDFSNTCPDATTSYRIPIIRVTIES